MSVMADRKPSDAELARRVSMLTAEHASLQAQRGSTQSEVLVRQGLYLTFASAVLVSLGLVAQAIGFQRDFFVIAICALGVVALLGFFTLMRQGNADAEDMALVLAMNRVRGAYVALDPALEPEFMASPNDDVPGAMRTYYPFQDRSNVVFASAAMFLTIVNSGIVGLIGGAVVAVSGGGLGLAVGIGLGATVLAILGFVSWLGLGYRHTQRSNQPRYPSPPQGS